MIYDFRGVDAEKIPRVYDASGVEQLHVLGCNTETGDVYRLQSDADGHILKHPTRNAVTCELVTVPSPLTVVPKLEVPV